MSDSFTPFRCGECGGTVRLLAASGETREFRRGISVEIPRDVLIPKCERCGEQYFAPQDAERVDAAVRAAYLTHQCGHYARLVDKLRKQFGCTLRDIENACGVTPTYFSHVAKGRRVASVTLTRLLEAYCSAPGEFARHVSGAGLTSSAAVLRAKFEMREGFTRAKATWIAKGAKSVTSPNGIGSAA